MTIKQLSKFEEFTKPFIIDPSLLVSKYYLGQLRHYEGELFFPSSFLKILSEKRKRESSVDFEYYCGYLIKRSTIEEIEQFLKEKQVKAFSKKDVKEYPRDIELYISQLKEIYPPNGVKDVFEEELLFLFTYSGLISRLKYILEKFGELFPLIDLTHAVPKEWERTVARLKEITNWIAFIGDFSIIGAPIKSAIEKIRMIIIDP